MRKHDADPDAIKRGADLTLQRNCIAYGLDRRSFTLDVRTDETAVCEIGLAYHPADGRRPFGQRRLLRAFLEAGLGTKAEVKSVVEIMVRNATLAFRPSLPAQPTGWSIHPVAASIIAAAGTALPNPADPLSWLLCSEGELHLPDGGGIVGATFHAREGVLLLRRASIVSRRGAVVATMGMDGHKTSIILPESYPETLMGSLAGRPVGALCDVFAADARGAAVSIRSARSECRYESATIVTLRDELVPLLLSTVGGERWRPRTVRAILGTPARPPHPYLGHKSHKMRRYYTRSVGVLRKAPFAPAPTP